MGVFRDGKENVPGFDDVTVGTLCIARNLIKKIECGEMWIEEKSSEKFPKHKILKVVKLFHNGLGKDSQVPKAYRPTSNEDKSRETKGLLLHK